MAVEKRQGGCQCGAIRYEIFGDALMTAICHCSMCRRANAAPAVAWAMYAEQQVIFSKHEPTTYASSAEARRGFCLNCGTQISFTTDFIPGLVDISIGSFDQPEMVAPTLHYWDSKRLPWIKFADDLPRFSEFPPSDQ